MAVYFLDSSALVKNYVAESGTLWVRNLIEPSAGNVIYISRVTTVEVVSAMARRSQGGSITPADAATLIARFKLDAAETTASLKSLLPLRTARKFWPKLISYAATTLSSWRRPSSSAIRS